MAADFPTSIATLATISPTDEMDDPGVEGDVVINRITEELVAVQTQVGVTGSAVVGTVEKRLTDVISTAATALAQSGVTSVAGQTGAVTLGVADVSGAAPLNSPGLTGTPTAPTAIPGTNTTQVATTAFVADAAATAVATAPGLITSVAGRTGAITLAVGDVTNAVATNDSRLSDSRTPTSHKISHATGGGDALTPSDIGAVATNDSRLTDARTPTAHKASHVTGGSDALSASDIGAAPLNSPGLTGTPTAPTAAPGTNTTQVATTAFVATAVSGATAAVTSVAGRTGAVTLAVGDVSNAVATNDSRLTDSRIPTSHKASHAIGGSDVLAASDIGAAALNSPGFTGTPTAPTAAGGTNTTQIATTAFVQSAVSGVSFPVTSVAGRTGAITLAVGDVTNAVATNDSRLTDARTPTSHKTSHATGGGDALTASDIGAVATNDSRLTDARTPTSHASSHAQGGGDSLTAIAIGAKPQTGFVNRTSSTLSMSGSTFQITTGSSYDIYSGGTKYTKSTTQSVSISNDLTQHFVYFDTAGILQVATSAWDITSDNVPVATVYRDGSTYVIGDERHSAYRDKQLHAMLHSTVGARYDLAYGGLTGTFTNTTLSVTRGRIYDEDILNDTGATKTTTNLYYRNTGLTAMRVEVASSTPYKASAGVIQYDNAGTLTNASNNNYVNYWLYATNDATNPLAVVVGQSQSSNLTTIRAEATPTILISTLEWKLIYRLTYRNVSSTATFIESADYRTSSSLPSGASPATNASSVTFAAAGNIAATNVQSALEELDAEKAQLAGLAGGQTLIGGTAASENLTLQSTAHATRGKVLIGSGAAYDEVNVRLGVGTQSPSAKVHVIGTTEQERLGYDASNYYAITVSSTGTVTHDATGGTHNLKGINSTATLGSELLTNGSFASNLSSWTDSGSSWSWSAGSALHTAGSASTLSQTVSGISNGTVYWVDLIISGRTAGSVVLRLGSVSLVDYGTATAISSSKSRVLTAADTGSVLFTITPSSDFDGKIDAVSLKSITPGSVTPTLVLLDSAGSLACSFRSFLTATQTLAIGDGAFRSVASGTLSSVAIGYRSGFSTSNIQSSVLIGHQAGFSANNAREMVCVGASAGYSCTSGHASVMIGWGAGYNMTTAGSNVYVGYMAGYLNQTAVQIVAVGREALKNHTTGSNTTAVGHSAGRWIADGSTSLTSATDCCYIGSSTKASADSVTNENVFGYNATGIGSNSSIIGSSAVTKCQIYGDMILDKTITAGGTTGAQTINKTCGSVNFAAAATSLVVTNSRVTTSSVIVATVATNDSTMKTVLAVPASGSFTLYANAAATAETRVNWIVLN